MSTKRIGFFEIILWLFVFLLILVSLTPFALGFKIKSDYAVLINDLSELSQADIKILKYDQGFFSSDVLLGVRFSDMPEQFQFKEELIHGPLYLGLLSQGRSPLVAAVVKGQLDIAASQQEFIQQVFSGNTPLKYQTVIDFSGDVDAQFYIPVINATFEDEFGPVHITSSGLIMNERYSSSTGHMQGDLQIPVFKVKSEALSMNAQKFSMSFSGSMGANDIMVGDSVMSINLLDIDSGEDQIALKDLIVHSVSSDSAGLINSNIRIEAREILASNQKFGPLLLDLSINGINAESMNQMQDLQKEVESKLQQGASPDEVNAMMTAQIMNLVPDLIKQAEMKIKPLSINSELGKLVADMKFTLDEIDDDASADPMFLLGAINLDLDVSIDGQLLRQLISWELENIQQSGLYMGSDANKQIESNIPLQQKVSENLQGMLDEQWLVVNEGVYLSKISMHKGELLINDQPVDPMKQIMSTMGTVGAQ